MRPVSLICAALTLALIMPLLPAAAFAPLVDASPAAAAACLTQGASAETQGIAQEQASQKASPELVVGASRYGVTIAPGQSATVIINGTIMPFHPTPISLWVVDPQNASSAVAINATSYSFGTEVALNKEGAWRIYAEVTEGEYYARTTSNNITINVTVQQPDSGSSTMTVAAAAAAAGAVLVLSLIIRNRKGK